MIRPTTRLFSAPLIHCLLASLLNGSAGAQEPASLYDEAVQLQQQGNYREALAKFRQLTLESGPAPSEQVANAVAPAVECHWQLNRGSQIDAFLEEVAARHDDDWRTLKSVATAYMGLQSQGYMIAGEFHRGGHRGGGKLVNARRRDRVRALQLLTAAMRLADESSETRQAAVADGLLDRLAEALLDASSGRQAWRLQLLTDVRKLPEYEEGWGGYAGSEGAAVDAEGQPVFYDQPASWDAAANDGERWRWALATRTAWQPQVARQELLDRADFLLSQFGVQTLVQYGPFFARAPQDEDPATAVYALHTLSDGETIARLATGIRRFELPPEHNYIKLLQRVVEQQDDAPGANGVAAERLAQIFENRRQYEKAAEQWRKLASRAGPRASVAADRLQQIVGNWGRFEPVLAQPAGRGATIDYRFRNGRRVEFTAHRVDVRKLLRDVKQYIKDSDGSLDWRQLQIENLGHRLALEGQQKYVGSQVASWSLDLQPSEQHFDRLITVTTPLQEAGAYLLTAAMDDGNTHRVVVWLQDTGVVKKPLQDAALYYVADAATGQPLPRCNVEFFGFRLEREQNGERRVVTRNFAELTDDDGMVRLPADEAAQRMQWLATATNDQGRLALLGYSNVWMGRRQDIEYGQVKALAITDRPVYRPGQPVQFKFWVRNAQFDMKDESRFANQTFQVEIRDPRNEVVFTESLVADAYGGLTGTWTAPEAALLGQYRLLVVNHGGGTFRLEQYKKPEFEVAVQTPEAPVALGDKIQAKITAKYYFGAPVVHAKVKYKVLRTTEVEPWFPPGPWDWLYGRGYGWLGVDYSWMAGWDRWGCSPPAPSWWWRPSSPPEVVAEQEVAIGADGQVEVEIDTAFAQAAHPNEDHRYEIQAEVVDQSRRMVVGSGDVLAAKQPFRVFVWTDRGFYRSGEAMRISIAARTANGEPVQGNGALRLLKLGYDPAGPQDQPTETTVATWDLATDDHGDADLQITAAEPGQYRLVYQLADSAGRMIEGGHVFTIRGEDFASSSFRFNDLEVIPERRHYQPGDKVALQINVNRSNAAVLLFVRPADGIYSPPKAVRIKGKSAVVRFDVEQRDMPNFFVEAVAVHSGRAHRVVREIHVPPTKRVINVETIPSSNEYRPGEQATIQLKMTDDAGRPLAGSAVVAIYDKALDYISGGGNVPDIREFFWKWRRQHRPQSETNLGRVEQPLVESKQQQMRDIGVFGNSIVDQLTDQADLATARPVGGALQERAMALGLAESAAPMSSAQAADSSAESGDSLLEPTVRQEFADTALWVGALQADAEGLAEVEFEMPPNLTTWKVNVWAMGHGTRVGQGSAEAVTRKDLLVRLQTPRFAVERDEVVLSANVHNYLDQEKRVRVRLEASGGVLSPMGEVQDPSAVASDRAAAADWRTEQEVSIPAGGEQRVDWRVRVDAEGEATVRVSALTDEESDAVQLQFPTLVHGMLKTDAFSGSIRPDETEGGFTFRVPRQRRPKQSRLEVRYTPSLAGAMVDALPYLIQYPHGCTEQTLNRFLPAVITQRTLQRMDVDLATIRNKRTNLNAQETGEQAERAQQWGRGDQNPVFDEAELLAIVKTGVNRLANMQLADGGWGWFSGVGETSSAHTTATVVRGLLTARANDVAIVPGVVEQGVQWLAAHQRRELSALDNWDRSAREPRTPAERSKRTADNVDALVLLVLSEARRAGIDVERQDVDPENSTQQDPDSSMSRMRDYLYQDRTHLAVYSLAMFGVALQMQDADEQLQMVLRNLSQYVQQDEENQTAWLELPGGQWWSWYGSEYEAQAYYLKLLAATEPDSEISPRLVKYLLNNRKHDSRWNSTRDTALVVEALADYMAAAGEDQPDLTLEIWIDGQKRKEVSINRDNLFSFDDRLVMPGASLEPGDHTVTLRKRGQGPIYFNGYSSHFTMEDPIDATGLELKVQRRYYKLAPASSAANAAGSRGQPIEQQREAYERTPIANFGQIDAGDLVEVELVVESKNDYEYVMLEDLKAAGFEPVEVRSGYNGNELGAYVEYGDQRVGLFVQRLMRGRHSVTYRLRAETPGKFSALPARASAMYAPELQANADEAKLQVVDGETGAP